MFPNQPIFLTVRRTNGSENAVLDFFYQPKTFASYNLAEYTGVRTFEVYSDYAKGCMDDIRLEGKHLPLPPALNGTQWGQATMARNLQRNCPSNDPCANVICPK